MRQLSILAFLLLAFTVKGDEPRSREVFVSPNGEYELRYQSGQFSNQSWSLMEKATGQVRYKLLGEFDSRTVLVGDNGVNLVVVDDFSERRPGPGLDVLLFIATAP